MIIDAFSSGGFATGLQLNLAPVVPANLQNITIQKCRKTVLKIVSYLRESCSTVFFTETKIKHFKGTVSVISSDPPCKDRRTDLNSTPQAFKIMLKLNENQSVHCVVCSVNSKLECALCSVNSKLENQSVHCAV